MNSFLSRTLIFWMATVCLALPASATSAEVDVKLKDGSKVTGAVLVQDNEKLVILVQASNGVYRKTINKTDIAEVKERTPAKPAPLGPKDVERLQKQIKTAEEEVRRREKDIPTAQQAFDTYLRNHANAKPSTKQGTTANNQERNLHTRLANARTQAEIARSKLNALYKERETVNQKMAASELRSK